MAGKYPDFGDRVVGPRAGLDPAMSRRRTIEAPPDDDPDVEGRDDQARQPAGKTTRIGRARSPKPGAADRMQEVDDADEVERRGA